MENEKKVSPEAGEKKQVAQKVEKETPKKDVVQKTAEVKKPVEKPKPEKAVEVKQEVKASRKVNPKASKSILARVRALRD